MAGLVDYNTKRSDQHSQAVKKECGPQKDQRCEIKGGSGSQEMAVMVG